MPSHRFFVILLSMDRGKSIRVGFVFALILFSLSSTVPACERIINDPASPGYQHPITSPLIFGKPFQVPAFTLKIVYSNNNKPLRNAKIHLFYVWKWLEYPQTENLFPGWAEAYELTTCDLDDDEFTKVPTYEVVTRGWYKGRWLLGRKPKFDHFTIQVPTKKRLLTYDYSEKDLEKLRKQERPEIILQVSE